MIKFYWNQAAYGPIGKNSDGQYKKYRKEHIYSAMRYFY